MKCSACGKTIQHLYHLDGKIYGYNCYKQALSLKYVSLRESYNNSYIAKCISAIEIFSNIEYKKDYTKKFQNSILQQWSTCKKLTGKQFECIINKFNNIQYINYMLLYVELFKDEEVERHIYIKINEENLINEYKNNQTFLNIIKNTMYKASIKKGKTFYIVTYKDKDIDDDFIYCELLSEQKLTKYKNDKDTKILDIIEIK